MMGLFPVQIPSHNINKLKTKLHIRMGAIESSRECSRPVPFALWGQEWFGPWDQEWCGPWSQEWCGPCDQELVGDQRVGPCKGNCKGEGPLGEGLGSERACLR